jgi:septal ring factor EnvC (AmiA/AmiB activator)
MKPLALPAVATAAICCAVLAIGPAQAATGSLEQRSSAAAGRIDRISMKLSEDRAGYEQASRDADRAAAREAGLTGEIENGAARVAVLRQRLDDQTAALEKARARLRRAERLLAERLAAIYMGGPGETIDLVLGSEDFGQLSTRAEYLLSIREADQKLAERVRSVRSALQASVSRLDALETEAESRLAALNAARAQISSVRAAAEQSAARLASLSEKRSSEIEALRADIEAWEEQIRRREAKTAAEAEQEVAAQLGGPYSIPTYIVMCESGGNYSALNPSSGAGGAYQILPSTWTAYGGEGLPHEASKAEQDRIAALIWANDGPGAWVCAG